MLTSLRKRQLYKMHVFNTFITALCFVFSIKLRWRKTKSLYDRVTLTSIEGVKMKISHGNLFLFKYVEICFFRNYQLLK